MRLNWHDVEAKEKTHVTMGSSTDLVVANITQHANMKGNVTFSTVATTGAINLAMDIIDGNSAKVESASGFNNVNVQKKVGFTGTNDLLSSSNYPDAQAHRFDIVLSVNTGDIDLSLEYVAS